MNGFEEQDVLVRAEEQDMIYDRIYGRCAICDDSFELDSLCSREILCPDCKSKLNWLKINFQDVARCVDEAKKKR